MMTRQQIAKRLDKIGQPYGLSVRVARGWGYLISSRLQVLSDDSVPISCFMVTPYCMPTPQANPRVSRVRNNYITDSSGSQMGHD